VESWKKQAFDANHISTYIESFQDMRNAVQQSEQAKIEEIT
jgi:hypothetical protein